MEKVGFLELRCLDWKTGVRNEVIEGRMYGCKDFSDMVGGCKNQNNLLFAHREFGGNHLVMGFRGRMDMVHFVLRCVYSCHGFHNRFLSLSVRM